MVVFSLSDSNQRLSQTTISNFKGLKMKRFSRLPALTLFLICLHLMAANSPRISVEAKPAPLFQKSSSTKTVRHKVKRGETLSGIAARYGTTIGTLARLNGISARTRLVAGKYLRVPSGSSGSTSAGKTTAAKNSRATGRYRVRRGDTLSTIARRYGTTAGNLAVLNGMSQRSRLLSGSVIRVPSISARSNRIDPRNATGGVKRVIRTHRIRRGETLGRIAVRYNTSVSSLARLNRIGTRTRIVAGRTLKVPSAAPASGTRAVNSTLRAMTLANIASDDTSGEDLELRQVAIDALDGWAGTVVIMDPNTGRVLTVVNQRMAVGEPVTPCSTIKLLTGLAALHEEEIEDDLNIKVTSRGSTISLNDALARSDNRSFQVLGTRLGYKRLIEYAENFGFGEKTGINIPGESSGYIPEKNADLRLASSHGRGYGVTAIQLAAFTSAIANGGKLYVPQVIRTPEDAENFEPELRRVIEMDPDERLQLLAGMIGAVKFGTAKRANNPSSQVAGKTGTCTGRYKRGLFTSFSSVNDPKLVVTVVTSGSIAAGKHAAEIAGDIYRSIAGRFFKDHVVTPASLSDDEDPPEDPDQF